MLFRSGCQKADEPVQDEAIEETGSVVSDAGDVLDEAEKVITKEIRING